MKQKNNENLIVRMVGQVIDVMRRPIYTDKKGYLYAKKSSILKKLQLLIERAHDMNSSNGDKIKMTKEKISLLDNCIKSFSVEEYKRKSGTIDELIEHIKHREQDIQEIMSIVEKGNTFVEKKTSWDKEFEGFEKELDNMLKKSGIKEECKQQ